MSKKFKSFVGVLLATMMVLTACGGGGQTGGAGSGESQGAKAPDGIGKYEGDGITITWWHALEEQYNDLVKEVVDGFNSTHDKIKVEAKYIGPYSDVNEALVAAHAAGTGLPGVVVANTDYVAAYGKNGVFEDLTPYIQATNYDVGDFAKGLLVSAQYEGKQVSLPFLHSTQVIYYNKTIADQEGIEIPTSMDQMEAFFAKATKKGADGKVERYGLEIPGWDQWYFETMYLNDGVKIITDENKTDLGGEDALARTAEIQKWIKDGNAVFRVGKDGSATMRQDFYDGKAFAIMHTSSLYNNHVDKSGFDVGMAWYPASAKTGNKFSEVGGCVLGIPSKNDQDTKNAAWEFLQYLCGKEINMKWAEKTGYIPTRNSVLDTDEGKAFLEKKPAFKPIFENLDLINPRIQHGSWSELATIWKNYMQSMMVDNADTKTSSENMAKEIDEILEDAK